MSRNNKLRDMLFWYFLSQSRIPQFWDPKIFTHIQKWRKSYGAVSREGNCKTCPKQSKKRSTWHCIYYTADASVQLHAFRWSPFSNITPLKKIYAFAARSVKYSKRFSKISVEWDQLFILMTILVFQRMFKQAWRHNKSENSAGQSYI